PFQLGVNLVLRRRDDAIVLDVVDAVRTDTRKRLLCDARALPHLFHAYQIAIVDVAGGADRHFEIVRFVAAIGEHFAHVIRHARRAGHRPDQAVGDGDILWNHTDG